MQMLAAFFLLMNDQQDVSKQINSQHYAVKNFVLLPNSNNKKINTGSVNRMIDFIQHPNNYIVSGCCLRINSFTISNQITERKPANTLTRSSPIAGV